MSEKINIQDIAALLAQKANITKKEAETFIRECFDTMSDALLTEESVKVKNLGNFKLLLVNDRESVDVVTGERVLLPAHYKISYTPDNELAQAVNEPFAFFDSVELLDEKVEETVSEEKKPEEIVSKENPFLEKDLFEFEEEEQVEILEEQEEVQIVMQEEVREETPVRKPVEEPEIIIDPYATRNSPKKKIQIDWALIACVIVFLLIIGAIYYIYTEKQKMTSNKIPSALTLMDDVNPYLINEDTTDEFVVEEVTEKNDTVSEPEAIVTSEPTAVVVPEEPVVAEKKRTIRLGERLTMYASEEYGAKCFWVYIYEENKNIIKDPNRVQEGITIVIPPAAKYGIDKNDPESIKKAKDLQRQYN
jgi:nucleoid DNA-binding protein/nucleoid-associated protein YgaU